MYINILNNVGRSMKFTEEEEEIFISLLKKETIPAKTKLLREGEICNFKGYVQKVVSAFIMLMKMVLKSLFPLQ